VPGPLVQAALRNLTGEEVRSPIRFEPLLPLASSAGASLARLIRFAVDELDQPESVIVTPVVAAAVVDAVVYGLLTNQPHSHAALLAKRLRGLEPSHVRRAAEYIEANLAGPITLADLSDVSGASVRALQAAFQRHHGCTPTEFLRDRRLERARARLLRGDPQVAIVQIARDCGFTHLGRFSLAYRRRFGETPTATRRRAGASR
jgi:AraC-like DNA-binding protein